MKKFTASVLVLILMLVGFQFNGYSQSRITTDQLPGMGVALDSVTGTSYVVACGNRPSTSDSAHMKLMSNAGSIGITLFKAGTCAWAPNFTFAVAGMTGSGTITITPTTSTIGAIGGSQSTTLAITAGQVYFIYTDVSTSTCVTNGCWDAVRVQ